MGKGTGTALVWDHFVATYQPTGSTQIKLLD
jgi:hypothetical protein